MGARQMYDGEGEKNAQFLISKINAFSHMHQSPV